MEYIIISLFIVLGLTYLVLGNMYNLIFVERRFNFHAKQINQLHHWTIQEFKKMEDFASSGREEELNRSIELIESFKHRARRSAIIAFKLQQFMKRSNIFNPFITSRIQRIRIVEENKRGGIDL